LSNRNSSTSIHYRYELVRIGKSSTTCLKQKNKQKTTKKQRVYFLSYWITNVLIVKEKIKSISVKLWLKNMSIRNKTNCILMYKMKTAITFILMFEIFYSPIISDYSYFVYIKVLTHECLFNLLLAMHMSKLAFIKLLWKFISVLFSMSIHIFKRNWCQLYKIEYHISRRVDTWK
jgi:hypothetical protein